MSKLGKDIKSKLTREMIDDLNLLHGIDVVAELENTLVKELDASIRKESRMKKIKKILNEKTEDIHLERMVESISSEINSQILKDLLNGVKMRNYGRKCKIRKLFNLPHSVF